MMIFPEIISEVIKMNENLGSVDKLLSEKR